MRVSAVYYMQIREISEKETAAKPQNLALDISKSRDTLLDAFVGRFTRSF